MALPISGTLSIADIAGEFGGVVPHALSEYYGVAAGIPASGLIAISDFYGASGVNDTGWLNPTWDGIEGKDPPTNPERAFDGNPNTAMTYSSGSGSVTSASARGTIAPIVASEILQVGFRMKGSSGPNVQARMQTTTADGGISPPSTFYIYRNLGSYDGDYTWEPSDTDFPLVAGWTVGNGPTYGPANLLGSSAGVLNWWGGGAGFQAIVQDYSGVAGATFSVLQVRVIYA